MQTLFDLGFEDQITGIRDRLRQTYGVIPYHATREPIGVLVKSIISCRTLDAISLRAYEDLTAQYPVWADMAAADPKAIKAIISEVTLAEREALYVSQALRRIAVTHPNFDLNFLRAEPVEKALVWLERLPGVGRKVSAATLNFSRLRRPSLVIDTHVLRVVRRLKLVSAKADTEAAYDQLMLSLGGWTAAELAELHSLIKRLGQRKCRAVNPDCERCPLSLTCPGLQR